MTALVLENLAILPAQVHSLRMLLAKLARAINTLTRARVARSVPEWRMRQVQSEIKRQLGQVRAAQLRRHKERTSSRAA
jgi:Mg2+ and Co2+ transporter CorA